MSSAAVAGVCANMEEAVFTLRQGVPLTWHGQAAEAFTEEVEAAVVQMTFLADDLRVATRLVQAHEARMRELAATIRWDG